MLFICRDSNFLCAIFSFIKLNLKTTQIILDFYFINTLKIRSFLISVKKIIKKIIVIDKIILIMVFIF